MRHNEEDALSEKTFNEPHIALNRIYTRAGDSGETRLVGGQRVPKDDARIDCFGVVDELNAFLGLARTTVEELSGQAPALGPFADTLKRVQHELFNLGSTLATLPEDMHPKQPRITTAEAQRLEREIDQANESLASLRSFVLPGGAASTLSYMSVAPSAGEPNACWFRSRARKACRPKR